ncbi:hypothetical protein EAI_04678 [Harpegnathos saltator]|uniref:SAM domain-containing protein n=1 Tax=Harpegnathos saltator TaxID=610380 RepID=E2BGE0_HARSA|nr:hypothetical protein EAI_04678 [Harpegnathos saltator]
MADKWSIDILKKWEFLSYEAIFKKQANFFLEQEIDKDSFLKLNEEHIRLLIPRFGPQAKFIHLWKNFVSSLQKIENADILDENKIIPEEIRIIDTIDTIVAIDTIDNDTFMVKDIFITNVSEEKSVNEESSTDVSMQIDELQSQQDVKLYLEQTSDGKSYFGIYNKQGFDNVLRTDLAKYIITAELTDDSNKRITPDDFKRLSLQIVQLFPLEIVDTWYIPRRKCIGTDRAVQPRGKLYNQYTRLICKLRRAELRSTNLQEEEENIDIFRNFNGAGSSETQLDSFQWLRRCLEPQNEAIVKWKETASVRLLKLRSTEYRRKKGKQFISEITEYFNEFRVLRQPWGYILLEQDFHYLYPNYSMQLLSNWEKIAVKIKKLLKTTIKSTTVEDNTFKYFSFCCLLCTGTVGKINLFSEEIVKVLLAIPTLFSPTNVGKWRPTAADLGAGFLLHIKVVSVAQN